MHAHTHHRTITYLKEFGNGRVNNHKWTMNQMNDAIFHWNIAENDFCQHNARCVLRVANDRI
jgi:hypothetical protein